MRIKIVSDLHLEFGDINILNNDNCDLLILSGDIMTAADLHQHSADDVVILPNIGRRQKMAIRFRDFLKRCSDQFPHVIYIPGNHEFYHFRWDQTIDVMKKECARYPNVYFLERESKILNDITFIGATLWTDMNKGDPITLHAIRDMMNDFNLIRKDYDEFKKLMPLDTVHRHRRTLEYIKICIDNNPNGQFVICGHHSPSRMSTHEMYKNEHITNGAYSSDLSEFILDHPQIKIWTHGHTHFPFDYMIGTTRIVCNPRGYEGYESDNGWNPNMYIDL